MVRFGEGIRNGAKVVALDTRLSETAAKADEWVAVRPGSDLAFALGMMREMMTRGFYDEAFLRQHTNMPFLTYRNADGESRLLRDDDNRPYVVDGHTGEVRALAAFSHHNRADADGNPVQPVLQAPAGTTVDGEPAETVFQAQLAAIDHCTPEWAAEETGVDADTIRRVAREFGTTRPAVVDPGWHGARYDNMQMLRRVQAMLQALVGGIDTPGGWIMGGEYRHKAVKTTEARQKGQQPMHAPLANMAGLPFFQFVGNALSSGENFSHGRPGWAWAWAEQQRAKGEDWVMLPAMADTGLRETVEGKLSWNGEPYKARALFMNAANPVHHYYPDENWKAILTHDNMELVVVTDVLPSDTVPYADVILPNSTYLERDEPRLYGNFVNHDLQLTTRQAAIDPLYDTREIPDILLKMSEIISGSADGFIGALEKLTGQPAAPTRKAYRKHKKKGAKNPFALACREVSMEQNAHHLGISARELEDTIREKGFYHIQGKDELLAHHAMPRKTPVPTDTGRVEFFSTFFEGLREAGGTAANFHPLAVHIPANCRPEKEEEAPLAEDEFYFTYGKVPTVSHGSTNSNNPILAAINRFKSGIYTGIWIHPDRAERLGLETGDPIRLSNTLSGQETTGHAYITRMVRPDTMFMYSAFGTENEALSRTAGIGTSTNKLIPYQVSPVVAGFRSQEFTIRIAKA
jgi:anaerobic selenocysteine-containing dehydrogenase